MKTVILCGGMGTRIRDANESLPKSLLPIGGQPSPWHSYEHAGFGQPMDTLREFNMLNELWSSGRAPWKVWA